ncbi:MAG TPA: bifunctional phosphoglucose/phosphomannose isomerase [Candidatus Eisenbacteria bacterium]|nr:bifunctional phosphoglucose/phosphomannose isomerase [Candidatus Eisenbacteria bacterium]
MKAAAAALEPPYGPRDAGGMAARIQGQPEQIQEAVERCAAHPWHPPIKTPTLLALGAVGGSAIAGDLTAGLYHDKLPHPMLTVREYHWPAFVTKDALALLCSYSGTTEETLALYREARERGVPCLAIASGGRLAEWCARDGVAWARVPGGSQPRAALFSSWVSITTLLHALGWVDDPARAWREATSALRARNASLAPDVPAANNPAKRMALELAGKIVFIYAGAERTGPVATRVRQQLNENAKMPGHSALVPELNHNEIVGWEHAAALPKKLAVLLLRDAEDSPATRTRLTLTGEYAARQGASVHEVESAGEGRLARLASLIQFGDYLSLYLALATGVDPTPIASIDEFKRRLAESAARGA